MIRYLFICLIIHGGLTASAQEQVKARPSPLALATIKHKTTYIKVTYSQPHKNGRDIFGSLVPYGQVWRTGANEATEITITKDITINSILLKAGTYSIFTIPEKEKWTIIINADLGLWGSYNYNPKQDVFRFDVPAQSTQDVYETLTFQFDDGAEMANLLILWDKTEVSIPIKFIY
jgi:hypothetical protein